MKFKTALLVTFFLIAITLTACGGKDNQGNVLFSDDFSNTTSGWTQVLDSTEFKTGYKDGAYQIVVNKARSNAWGNPGALAFTDVRVEVDATKGSGSDDNDFGIICRYQNPTNFYFAVVSSDGFYGIIKMNNGIYNLIGHEELQSSDRIKLGDETNHIRFDCIGSTLTLFVNDTQIDQQVDEQYTDGNVGLIAGTYDVSGTDISFDNFYVYQP
jgi:hypothetical protein